MTYRVLILITVLLFGAVGALYILKQRGERPAVAAIVPQEKIAELPLEEEGAVLAEDAPQSVAAGGEEDGELDRVEQLFSTYGARLPIVKTIVYKRNVPWLKGRSAWIADYASHYHTSRHFIARSLNGESDYDNQNVKDGDRFNVLDEEKQLEFYLLVDLSKAAMRLYYVDKGSGLRELIKTYRVGLGRSDPSADSGCLTPVGKYTLSDRVAVYRPKATGYHRGEKVEMVTVFGTRWIPFGEEIDGCSLPARGLGLHGIPFAADAGGGLQEDLSTLGKYESDGCIRLAKKDIEELFAIIITKPTTIEIVTACLQSQAPYGLRQSLED